MTTRGATLLLLCATAAAADPPKKESPPDSPAAKEYKALLKKQEDAQEEAMKAYQAAKTDADRQEAEKKFPDRKEYAKQFLALADRHPDDPAAVDALVWAATRVQESPERNQALDRLLRDHLGSDKLGQVCSSLAYSLPTGKEEAFLNGVIAKGRDRTSRAAACLSLGVFRQRTAEFAEILRKKGQKGWLDNPSLKGVREQLAKADPESHRKEAEATFERVGREFGDVKAPYGDDTYGERAAGYLFEMRNLVIGKKAPDIEGEDLDGKSLKLSDYRGKVVVLDFWGNW
jgi:hypothetical protein